MAADSGRPRQARRTTDQAGQVQTFRSPTALIIWVVWLLFAVANWIDLAVQGRDHLSAIAAAILLLVTGIAYDTAQRPRIVADGDGITVRNPLRDHQIGWASVSKVDVTDLVRVHTDWSAQVGAPPGTKAHSKIISAWAVQYSRRRQFAAEAKARRASGPRRTPFSLPSGTPASGAGASAEAEAQKIVRTLNERATAAQAEAAWAHGTVPIAGQAGPGPGETGPAGQVTAAETATETAVGTLGSLGDTGRLTPLRSTWSWPAIAAIVIPALILLVVWLV
jgi:hypothetical protein